jgi:hypothetical protein
MGVVRINAAGEWETIPWAEFLEGVELRRSPVPLILPMRALSILGCA